METLGKTIELLCKEKGISKEDVIEAVKVGIINAAKKAGYRGDLVVKIDEDGKDFGIYQRKKVVEEVTDPDHEISLEEARELFGDQVKLGDEVLIEIKTEELGRIAAKAAAQVIHDKITEAERRALFDYFRQKIGDVISGTVKEIKRNGDIVVDLGRVIGVLPKEEQIPKERYRIGDRVRAYIYDVVFDYKRYNRKKPSRIDDYPPPYVILSRTHPKLLKRLMEIEIPEVAEGLVEVKAVAREPGVRAKVAVDSKEDYIDPVGACIGVKGSRILPISRELSGEKIEIIRWSDDVAELVARALSPAKVIQAESYEDENGEFRVEVVVPDDQLSLAIGKHGVNARLASKLAGQAGHVVGIDIIKESDYRKLEELEAEEEEAEE
ncbi:NusA antitermination factor [Thermovibrio ammonificans HB-1]|uniref:Transcription termination/antitermination protein NusA n=1 Tax=Thermovibrio ammonificans (strain DSM 15698 / JCM 12110 / HB-1) TaxID=648996 RepID=E8T5J0_THEA1|nr:transcription termination factor NusA [Thermovibrio ammonificans]ADU97644.1 NusA antitermination factor [Thermovibrio ammonificans HB-1]